MTEDEGQRFDRGEPPPLAAYDHGGRGTDHFKSPHGRMWPNHNHTCAHPPIRGACLFQIPPLTALIARAPLRTRALFYPQHWLLCHLGL